VDNNQTVADLVQDVMQVCRNGHVVTDRLRACPEESRYHCERCGATTLHACPTCGQDLAGAVLVPGLQPIGTGKPPAYCPTCGAAFPWGRLARKVGSIPAAETLETLLRRLPLIVRQLRQRFRTRAPFRIEDEHDLEDLLRSLLPAYFDDIRLRSRTPSYSRANRTDLLINPGRLICTLKHTSLDVRQPQLEEQLREDAEFYRAAPECRSLWVYIHDPQGYLYEPQHLEALWSRRDEEPEVRCVISANVRTKVLAESPAFP
jgi:hypothetical protein